MSSTAWPILSTPSVPDTGTTSSELADSHANTRASSCKHIASAGQVAYGTHERGTPYAATTMSGPGSPVLAGQGPAVAVVAAGGVLGSLARWAVGLLLPAPPGTFPWATFGINVLGILLMGVLVVLVTEAFAAHPLVRPFLGVG